jgi:outer membrane lipoprotein-sorting protein
VVPAVVTAAVVATAVAVPLIADADSELPERSAAEVLSGLVGAPEVPFAGTVVYSADLGLPDLPALTGGDSSPWTLLSGATTARIWYTDPDTFRVALHGELSEVDLIRDGDSFWYWDSEENTVTHMETPDGPTGALFDADLSQALIGSEVVAELALQWLAPSTEITVDGTATVAGRSAYELVIQPRDERSLIGSIRVAIDGEHGVPLRIRVYGSDGGDPAIEVGFTSVSFNEPDPSVYEFTPPPGATSEELDLGSWLDPGHGDDKSSAGSHLTDHDTNVDVTGEDWTSILVVDDIDIEGLPERIAQLSTEMDKDVGDISRVVDALLGQMRPVSGPYGSGMAFESRLISLLLVEDGQLLVGAVSLDTLEEAAAGR